MVGSMSIVDILFLVTVILLVFSGIRNGAVISLFSLLGGAIGFVEAWVLWLVFLIILGNFLHGIQSSILPTASVVHSLNIQVEQYKSWHDFYNQAITNSLFAKVNAFFVSQLPALPQPSRS